jgi:acyl-CoA reductase-like NAD-dependent aldehyde dehydrogenase
MADGIDTADGHLTFDQVATGLATAVQKLLADPVRAVEILGAVVNEGVARRLKAARTLGPIVLDTQAIAHPQFPEATISTPLIVKLDAADRDKYLQEWFGPVAFVIATRQYRRKSRYCQRCNRTQGALTLSVYSTRDDVIAKAIDVAEDEEWHCRSTSQATCSSINRRRSPITTVPVRTPPPMRR